jgi:glutathione-independent formaldehyde dehydrogenase
LSGASEVYVVDSVPERLAKVKEMGPIPIDFTKGDPAEQIDVLDRDPKTKFLSLAFNTWAAR